MEKEKQLEILKNKIQSHKNENSKLLTNLETLKKQNDEEKNKEQEGKRRRGGRKESRKEGRED